VNQLGQKIELIVNLDFKTDPENKRHIQRELIWLN